MKQFGKQAHQIRELVEINLELMEENVALKAQVARLDEENRKLCEDDMARRGLLPVAPISPMLRAYFDRTSRERAEMLERNRAAMLGTKVNLSAFDESTEQPTHLMREAIKEAAEKIKKEYDGTAESSG